ncbi:MAG: hypothetical protein NZT92_15055 [Abditibacteriales bacterium]|nr:hypothetical protein [Abditibacteriales bacterium]
MAVAVVGFSLYFLASPQVDAEAKQWASTVLSSLITGAAGYLYGKSKKD